MKIKASDYGILPDKEVARQLADFTRALKELDGEKSVIFDSGDYFINAENLNEQMLFITNTVGDKEFGADEVPHKNRVALDFEGIDGLEVDFSGARFIIRGKATNAAIRNCSNITLKNGTIVTENPDLHELSVVSKTAFYVDFKVDDGSDYYVKGNSLWFRGADYDYDAVKKYRFAWHIAHIKADTPNTVKRTSGAFATALGVKQLENGLIRIKYLNTSLFGVGDRLYLFDNRRQYAGIFVDNSRGIVLDNMAQHFNYSLSFVAQDSEELTIKSCTFAPEKSSGRLMSSCADFVQICMCRGRVLVENNYFEGAGDDCLNAHGIHFKIKQLCGNKITVSFMHPQSHGFNPLHIGDEVAFINPSTLLEEGRARIISSALLNEYDIELELESVNGAQKGFVIEDLTQIPSVYFLNNTVNRIITRAVLLTIRGKAVVDGNHFISNSMSGVLLSDDAKSWYESGPCHDVTISNNVFDYCGQTPILVLPENKENGGAVHKNITISGNSFNTYKGEPVSLKCADNVKISGNSFASGGKIKATGCTKVVSDI